MNALPGLSLAGDLVLAPWAEDGFDYEATLEEVDEALTSTTRRHRKHSSH